MTAPQLAPLGDSMVTITLGEGISEELSAMVVSCARAVEDAQIIGVTDVVPAYTAVGIHFDPLAIEYDDLRDRLLRVLEHERAGIVDRESTLHTIEVRYDGEDLAEVAERTGLTPTQVMTIHSEREYRGYVVGFVPGFAYLGTLDDRLVLPRRASPRKRVPRGAVAIADAQTGIYPSSTPGGWHLIGTADVTLFDPNGKHPSLLRVGDRVKFQP
jgi:KipI family sensor histidine kinase inhibitor